MVIFFAMVWRINNPDLYINLVPAQFELGLTFVLLGASSLLWLLFSIKCPECKKSVPYYYFNNIDSSTAFTDMISAPFCPYCRLAKK